MPRSAEPRRSRSPLRVAVAAVVLVAAAAGAWTLGVHVAERRAASEDRPLAPIGHVHALAAPAWLGGDLLVGSHHGLLRWSEAAGWRAVGVHGHDFMGLAADPHREGVLYGSGHPDLRSDLVNPLGLIVSRDGGRTWADRSLAGRSDFHAMAVTDEAIWGWDVMRPAVVRSLDEGATWIGGDDGALAAVGMVFALAADPASDGGVFAATGDGAWWTSGDGVWRRVSFAGSPVTAIHAVGDAVWAYVAEPGTGLVRSLDAGATWQRVALGVDAGFAVIAITSDPSDARRVFAAVTNGDLLYSADGGASWRAIMRSADPR
ncbi:MAG: hypothetical protein EA416_11010 [Trueperaceae bacterium]|nr:MAG: hypothetical protein EA416_11010 [Trueperaceae bacterium]